MCIGVTGTRAGFAWHLINVYTNLRLRKNPDREPLFLFGLSINNRPASRWNRIRERNKENP